MLPDRARQPGRHLDREHHGRLRNRDPAARRRLIHVPAGLPRRAAEPAGQHPRRLRRRHAPLSQLCGRVDPLSMLAAASAAMNNHAINILPDMSLPGRDTPQPFQPPVTQRDIEAEVIYCVGGVTSPILSNIYLDRLDTFVETVLIPQHTRGASRTPNPAYARARMAAVRARKRGDLAAAREMRKQQRSLPSVDPRDPGYRRLRYCRYADDTLLGFTGPKAEAEQIRQRLAQFLREDLKLELNPDKTLITHARTQAAHYLGYEITVQHSATRPAVNGSIALRVPKAVIKAKCAPYLKRGKPARRTELMNQDDHVIISTYGAEYRGLVQYYLLAGDVWRLSRLQWVTLTSLLKTLAARHRSTVAKMARKYGATIDTPHGPRRCFEARVERAGRKPLVARFGGIPLKRQKKAVLQDRQPVPVTGRKELVIRLQAGRCELCEERARVEVHQVRKLADLTRPGRPQPAWAHLMAKMRRKTLIVCLTCHNAIHARQPAAIPTE
jgi:hypothetical protein